jgi:hypothetical protein
MSGNVQGHPKGGECLLLGETIVCNVGADWLDLKVECFPGIRTGQLRRVIVNRDFGSPDTLIHVGTNNVKRARNYYVTGGAYDLINTSKIQGSLGVLLRRDVSWRRIVAIDDTLEWVVSALGIIF